MKCDVAVLVVCVPLLCISYPAAGQSHDQSIIVKLCSDSKNSVTVLRGGDESRSNLLRVRAKNVGTEARGYLFSDSTR